MYSLQLDKCPPPSAMNARHSYVHVIVGTMPDAILLPGQCNIRDIKHRSLGWNIADELSDTFHFLIGK